MLDEEAVRTVSEAHRHALAADPPFRNTDENGANLEEPSRGTAAPPKNVRIIPPEDVSPCVTEAITASQVTHDKKRSVPTYQPQPTINTKGVLSSAHVAGGVKRNNSTRGSINEDGIRPRQYRSKYGDHSNLAPNRLQPTNDDKDVRESYQSARSHDDCDPHVIEGSVQPDDDPEALYRTRTLTTNPFDDDESTARLSKEERKAEKQELKARKRQKLVRDPVTGQEIWIENTRGNPKKVIATEGVVSPTFNALQMKDASQILSMLHKVPLKDEKSNVLFYPMNPPEWKELLLESQRSLFQWGYVMIAVLLSVQLLLSPFPARFALWINALLSIGSILFVKNKVKQYFLDAYAQVEKVRGENATLSAVPESVEWLNNIIKTIWPTINPEIFAGPADVLEDVLQRQVPTLINSVKVSDLDIGLVPLRLLSMKYLPDDGAPRSDEDSAGEYINLEVTFGYRAGKTNKSLGSRAQNIHLLIWFMVGLKKVIGIPIPVWVEIVGILGRARVRIQLLPDPPFLKNGTITFLGMPKVDLKTTPITTYLFNVMNLPFVSQIVSFAVKTVLKDLIAPRSYTVDISKLMVGDDVKKETASIGILMICLHGAINVPRADRRPGHSRVDPYLTVQYSRFGKTMYSTRVIAQDFNPVWEETCFLPILPSVVKAGEKLRINLWDSDRFTADDLLGRVDLDVTTLVVNPGQFERRIDKVVGTAKTHLHWSVGFFSKKEIPDTSLPPVSDSRVPDALREDPAFKPDELFISVDSKTEKLICRTPPDPDYPGILSIQIHQINELGINQAKKKLHQRNGRALQDEAAELGQGNESGSAASSYCTVALNDELVYKTRTRAFTDRPIFNASFERFVRSFQDTKICITVRDQRFREEDPIVGILPLSLRDELKSQGQVTRWYPISEGLGYGVIRVSLLFRSIDCRLPRTLQGWNVGTLYIHAIRAVVDKTEAEALKDCSLRIDTMLGHKTIGALHASIQDGVVNWDLGDTLVMPIRRRHATSLSIECHRGGIPFTKNGFFSGVQGACIIGLSALDDDVRSVVRIPIFQTDDYVRFKQNSLTQSGEDTDKTLRKLGYMEVDCILESGLSDIHRKFAKRSGDLHQMHETWETEISLRKRLAFNALRDQKEEHLKTKLAIAERQRRPSEVSFLDTVSNSATATSEVQEADRDDFVAALDNDNSTEWDEVSSLNSQKSVKKNIAEWYQDKKREQREMYRRHRGIMQRKPARTALWMKNSVKQGVSRFSRALSLNREDDLVENEV